MTTPTKTTQSAIDWEQVRERLGAGERALAEALSESPSRVEAAYRKRAKLLANGSDWSEPRTAGISSLVFGLHQERYAIGLDELTEVLPFGACTPVPGAAAEFLGVINLRGELWPVVDLARVILNTERGPAGSGFVLMLRRRKGEIGLKVDHVEGLREVPSEKISPSAQGKYTRSISGETLLLLDLEKVLEEIFP
jgi:purine-binding chemotaxis protein CheW